MSVNTRFKATKIISQRKAFYRQRIPEFSCARKETVDIDILVTSRNGDRKIMQSIRITSRPPWEKGRGTSWASSEEQGLSSFNSRRFCYSYAWFCSLCERRSFFYTGFISRKCCRFLPMFLIGFTSLCLTFFSSINHLLHRYAQFFILFHLT